MLFAIAMPLSLWLKQACFPFLSVRNWGRGVSPCKEKASPRGLCAVGEAGRAFLFSAQKAELGGAYRFTNLKWRKYT